MLEEGNQATARLLAAIERGDISADIGYLVGLDRPAMLAPDPAAMLAARRREDVLARGHRWRVVNLALWRDLLQLGRERPEQRVYVLQISALEEWMDGSLDLYNLNNSGWRGDQGTTWIMPILDETSESRS